MLKTIEEHWLFFEDGFTNLTSMWNDAQRGMQVKEYREALLRSTFTLCPGGGNVETFRVSEALETGSIPILESSEEFEVIYPLHPMPYVRAYHQDLPSVIQDIVDSEDGGVPTLRKKLVDYWVNLKADLNSLFLQVMDPSVHVQEVVEARHGWDASFADRRPPSHSKECRKELQVSLHDLRRIIDRANDEAAQRDLESATSKADLETSNLQLWRSKTAT